MRTTAYHRLIAQRTAYIVNRFWENVRSALANSYRSVCLPRPRSAPVSTAGLLAAIGCTTVFSDNSATIAFNGINIITGTQCTEDKLWYAHLPPVLSVNAAMTLPSASSVNAAVALRSDKEFVLFAHAALGSPATSTLLNALRQGYLASFPRLTDKLVTSHPPHTIATAKGHLDQLRQGIDSTSLEPSHSPDTTPSSPGTHVAYVKTVLISGTAHSDLTGRFPVPSDTGSQYLFLSTMDGYIHAEPLPTRHQSEYVKAYQRTIDFFHALGHPIMFQRLDNESSTQLEQLAKKNRITIQYCPPANHRAHIAERSIRTYKNHFVATLATAAKDFPIRIWDRILSQVEICINHLLPYKPNPLVSAYAGIHGGSHDFRAHPIAPAGTRVLIHDKPANRGTWAAHGAPGFYLGPALKHYRCYEVCATTTQTLRVADALAWFPEGYEMPEASPLDVASAAVIDLTNGNAFALVVDDFRLTYVTREAAEHLHNALSELYEM